MKGTARPIHEAIRCKTDLSKHGFNQGQSYDLHVTAIGGTKWAVFTPDVPGPTSGGYKTFNTLQELLDNFEFTINF